MSSESEWVGLKFQRGDRVRTGVMLGEYGWAEGGQETRYPNKLGIVVELLSSRKLCFLVVYDYPEHHLQLGVRMTTHHCGFFGPDELELVSGLAE